MDARKALLAKREKLVLSPKSALSTGSTLLNLACTDHSRCGFVKGCYYYLVGDSTSGKTWLTLTCFAESVINENFKDYELIFDDVEGGALMDIERYFGKAVAQKMRAPDYKNGVPVNSETVQDFYYNLKRFIDKGEPFIYVLDSQDALGSTSAQKKFAKQRKAAQEGGKEKGSWGDGKAKFHSENIRWVLSGLRKTKSILIVIGQTRDNLEMFSFEKQVTAGGKSLKFYANSQIWTSVGKKIQKEVRGKNRTIGVFCKAEVRKNRVTGKIGKDRQVTIPIYYGYGIDDVGSCVDFLIENDHFVKKGQGIYKATGLEFTGSRNEIVAFVEKEGKEHDLRLTTAQVWRAIEAECQLAGRKKRYE